jgi:hypothetical protein
LREGSNPSDLNSRTIHLHADPAASQRALRAKDAVPLDPFEGDRDIFLVLVSRTRGSAEDLADLFLNAIAGRSDGRLLVESLLRPASNCGLLKYRRNLRSLGFANETRAHAARDLALVDAHAKHGAGQRRAKNLPSIGDCIARLANLVGHARYCVAHNTTSVGVNGCPRAASARVDPVQAVLQCREP